MPISQEQAHDIDSRPKVVEEETFYERNNVVDYLPNMRADDDDALPRIKRQKGVDPY
jgi:hypothetical protein